MSIANEEIYLGCKEINECDGRVAEFYSDKEKSNNIFNCLTNEYIIINNSNKNYNEYYKWNGSKYIKVEHRTLDNGWTGVVKARNPQQVCAIDMLMNNDITVKILAGKFGVGKDFLMIAAALDLIKKNVFDKIVWVRNNISVKNTKDLGALPGTEFDKLLPFVMPLVDHIGDIAGLEMLIKQNRVELLHLGYARGRDLRNSIIYVTECENNTKEHVQLLIGRVGEGSALWLNGDYKQTDSTVFEKNNGLLTAVNKLKGHKRFGYVHMVKSERSETAAMADLLD